MASRPVKPEPMPTLTRPGAMSTSVAMADAVTRTWRRLGISTPGLGGARQGHPHVELERGRVVDPGPPIAQALGERDVFGRVWYRGKRAADIHEKRELALLHGERGIGGPL